MQVFVYEYTCAGGRMVHPLSAALQAEGWAMLSALLDDFARVSGLQTITLLNERCRYDNHGGVCRRVRSEDEEAAFRELAAAADFTLVIAPEFDDLLLTRCGWVEAARGRLLGCSSAAVKLTGDKLALYRHLRDQGVPTPESRLFTPGEEVPNSDFPLVWKPRHGAGSQATFLVQQPEELRAFGGRARAEGWSGEALVQTFVPGEPASVAFLVGSQCQVALLPAAQRLSQDGRFHYLGGTVPLPANLAGRAVKAATHAIKSVPNLGGYVGVDVVLGNVEDGSRDAVIEINPRPTTSYVGLRALARTNLAEALLQIVAGNERPRLAWRPGVAHFDANGTVTLSS